MVMLGMGIITEVYRVMTNLFCKSGKNIKIFFNRVLVPSRSSQSSDFMLLGDQSREGSFAMFSPSLSIGICYCTLFIGTDL
jgi:hypothetical protein